jgi:hypothetical protein
VTFVFAGCFQCDVRRCGGDSLASLQLNETVPESVTSTGNFKTIAVGIVDRLSLVGDELALASVPLQHSVCLDAS